MKQSSTAGHYGARGIAWSLDAVRCVCVGLVLAAGATIRAAPIMLAKTGNMPTVCERAEHLMVLDPRYAAFASRPARLADGQRRRHS